MPLNKILGGKKKGREGQSNIMRMREKEGEAVRERERGGGGERRRDEKKKKRKQMERTGRYENRLKEEQTSKTSVTSASEWDTYRHTNTYTHKFSTCKILIRHRDIHSTKNKTKQIKSHC